MALQFDLSGAQIDGARDYQEDAFLISRLTDAEGHPSALIIVADGMGGHAAGNVASNMAVQAFNKHVSSNYPSENPSDILYECVIKANASIKDTIKETPALAGMGCTLVAGILEQGKLWWASVGDSHLYLLRGKQLTKQNADHSYGGFLDRMEAEGTPVEPEPGLSRNMLMSAITGEEIDEIDVSEEPSELLPGDRILLCSDGLDTLSKGKIIQFADWSDSPKECADALLSAVEEAAMPKQDNTTIIVVDVKDAASPEAAQTPQATEQDPTEEDSAAETTTPMGPTVAAAGQAGTQPSQEPAPSGGKGGKGILMAFAALIMLGLAAGAYYILVIDRPTPPATASDATTDEAASQAEAEPEPPETTDTTQSDAPDSADVEATPPAETDTTETGTAEAETAETETTDTAVKAAPETTQTGQREFHDTLKDGSPGPTMVWIPAGSFEMGSPGTSRKAEERPRHTVQVGRFAMSKYEITFSQYDKFARATGREIPDDLFMERDTHPVIFVSWDDAFNYAQWLSEQTGKNYRLPSEAEWEYAAGAGKESTFWWGYDEEPGRAHCFGCETGLDPRKPTEVGQFDPNPFGLYDTAGNVAEWVYDCWHKNYNDAPSDGSVWRGGDCSLRIARGGAYSTPPKSIRHSKRDKFKSDSKYDHIGIRVVREP